MFLILLRAVTEMALFYWVFGALLEVLSGFLTLLFKVESNILVINASNYVLLQGLVFNRKLKNEHSST